MKVLIIGHSGTIGNAVTKLLREKGHEIVIASRSTQPALTLDDPTSIDSFFSSSDYFDAIIIAAGQVAGGPIVKLTDQQVELSLKSKLAGQINIVRKGLAKLRPNGVFVLTGGMLAFLALPATSLYAAVNAGLDAFVKAVAKDLTDGRRIAIVHPPYVAETAAKLGMNASEYPSADEAAKAYVQALESDINGDAIFIQGFEPK